MEKPQYIEGDVFHWVRNGKPFSVTITRVAEGYIEATSQDGCFTRERAWELALTLEWSNCKGQVDGWREVLSENGALWPMEVGNWSQQRTEAVNAIGSRWISVNKCKVAGTAIVTTSVGVFETFEVVCKTKSSTRWVYFSPKHATAIYYRRINHRSGKEMTQELRQYQRGDGSPSVSPL